MLENDKTNGKVQWRSLGTCGDAVGLIFDVERIRSLPSCFLVKNGIVYGYEFWYLRCTWSVVIDCVFASCALMNFVWRKRSGHNETWKGIINVLFPLDPLRKNAEWNMILRNDGNQVITTDSKVPLYWKFQISNTTSTVNPRIRNYSKLYHSTWHFTTLLLWWSSKL